MGFLQSKNSKHNQHKKRRNNLNPTKSYDYKNFSFSQNLSHHKNSLEDEEEISSKDFCKLVYSNSLADKKEISNKSKLRTKSVYDLNQIQENKVPALLKKRKSCYYNIPFKKRRISITNFNNKNNSSLKNSILNKNDLKQSLKKYVTYEDIYFESEMFVIAPSSFPGDYEKSKISLLIEEENEIKINDNIEMDLNDIESDDNDEFLNNSFSYKNTHEDDLHLNYFLKPKKNNKIHDNNNLIEKNKINIIEKKLDSNFIDEEEIEGENISYIKDKNELNQIMNYSTEEGGKTCNISFMSVNLFIKKIALGEIKSKYLILLKCFLAQFYLFIPLDTIILKIINALEYYLTSFKKETPDLIELINTIISSQYEKIKSNNELLEKIRNIYKKIEWVPWLDKFLIKDINNIKEILSEDNSEFDEYFMKSVISGRKSRVVFVKLKSFKENKNKNSIINKRYFYIFDYTDAEIAYNLSCISYKIMADISINEILGGCFTKKNKKITSPNVVKLIERFDKLILFIIEDICSYDKPKKRAKCISKWVNIENECLKQKNFNDLIIINACFSNYLLKKMRLTWKNVPKNTLTLLNKLKIFCSSNQCYKNIRKEILNCRRKPHVPYLGILLKDIVIIEEKLKYMINGNNINFFKLQKVYGIIYKFFEFKNYPFGSDKIPDIDILKNIVPKSEDEIEKIVKNIEPKLLIHCPNGDKKRKTNTDIHFYK